MFYQNSHTIYSKQSAQKDTNLTQKVRPLYKEAIFFSVQWTEEIFLFSSSVFSRRALTAVCTRFWFIYRAAAPHTTRSQHAVHGAV